MVSAECLETVLPIVAESWDRLRETDVQRLLEQINYNDIDGLSSACRHIYSQRTDLRDSISAAAAQLAGENGHAEPIKLTRDILGTEVYRDVNGHEWLREPNGDLIFLVRLY